MTARCRLYYKFCEFLLQPLSWEGRFPVRSILRRRIKLWICIQRQVLGGADQASSHSYTSKRIAV